MKKFLTKTIIILLPIILVWIVTETILKQIPNNYKYKSTYLNENIKDIQILILGSSHSFYGVNPTYFTYKAFNSANVSQTFDYDYKIFNKYKGNYEELKAIVIPISYFSLWSRLHKGIEKWRCFYYLDSYGFYEHINLKNYFFTGTIKEKKQRIEKFLIKNQDDINCDTLGFGHNNTVENNFIATGKETSLRHTYNLKKRKDIYLENIKYLNSMIEWCDNHNITVLLFTPPAYISYRKHLNKEQLNKTIKTGNNLSQKYKNCIYINYITDSTFTKKYFQDADHLNELGAEKLTKQLNSLIIFMLDC